jgi:hypothetical protein
MKERKKLYQIFRVIHNVNKPAPTKMYNSIKIVEENGNWAYPLVEVMSSMANHWNRDDFISLNISKLQRTVKYLNEMADDNESYDIREVEYPKHLF